MCLYTRDPREGCMVPMILIHAHESRGNQGQFGMQHIHCYISQHMGINQQDKVAQLECAPMQVHTERSSYTITVSHVHIIQAKQNFLIVITDNL